MEYQKINVGPEYSIDQVTDLYFWVGVKSGVYPSPPMDRKKTNTYTSYPVYCIRDTKQLSFLGFSGEGLNDKVLYLIPEDEYRFIQDTSKADTRRSELI